MGPCHLQIVYIMSVPNLFLQKFFGDSVSQDARQDYDHLVSAANEVGFTEADGEGTEQYLLLSKAIDRYIPGDTFNGSTVLVQARTKSRLLASIPNEDYNVSLVSSVSNALRCDRI